MRNIQVIILLALVALDHAKEWEANHAADAPDKFLNRALKESRFNRKALDETILGKPGAALSTLPTVESVPERLFSQWGDPDRESEEDSHLEQQFVLADLIDKLGGGPLLAAQEARRSIDHGRRGTPGGPGGS